MISNETYIFLAVFAALALVALLYLLSPMSLPDEPLLYLIGVNHAMQFKPALSQLFGESVRVHNKREAFKAHIAEMIDKLDIDILAEEFSDEAKRFSDEAKKKSGLGRCLPALSTRVSFAALSYDEIAWSIILATMRNRFKRKVSTIANARVTC